MDLSCTGCNHIGNCLKTIPRINASLVNEGHKVTSYRDEVVECSDHVKVWALSPSNWRLSSECIKLRRSEHTIPTIIFFIVTIFFLLSVYLFHVIMYCKDVHRFLSFICLIFVYISAASCSPHSSH